MKWAVFLRGINVGGNKKVPMAELKKMCESLDCTNVKTFLASGNVILESGVTKASVLEKNIQGAMEKTFGFTAEIIVRPFTTIQKIVDSDPFKGVTITKEIRLFVTFQKKATQPKVKIPYHSENGAYSILTAHAEIYSVLDLSKNMGSVDAMKILEQQFGKNITTRSFKTLQRMTQ